MKWAKKIFRKVIRVRGAYIASFVFENKDEAELWLLDSFPMLCKKYGELSYVVENLDGLRIGEDCRVQGEGLDLFEITGIVKYSTHRYGFKLNSGWTEEVAKCYRPANVYLRESAFPKK